MPLPEIVIPNPITVPAKSSADYNRGYITRMRLTTFPDVGETTVTDGANQSLTVAVKPYNAAATPKVYQQPDEDDVVHTISNLWAEVYRVPLLAQVMGGIVTAVNLLIQEKSLLRQIEFANDEDKPALEVQLAELRTQLGVV